VVRYWWLVVRRAWGDTRRFGEWRRSLGATIVTIIVTIVALQIYHLRQGSPAAFQQIDWFLSIGVGLLLTAPVIFMVFLVLAPRRIHAEQERRIALLEAERTQKLTLEFDPDDPACKMRIGNLTTPQTLYRIRIVNRSDKTIAGLQVKLTDLEPRAVQYLPAPLQFKDEPPTTREMTLNPGSDAPVYVDVVQQAEIGGPLTLWHTIAGQERQLTALGDFTLLLDNGGRARLEVFRDQALKPWTF